MSTVKSQLTIIFDPPFYKAVFERYFDSTYQVGQVNLGTSEPKLTYIYALIIYHWTRINFYQQEATDISLVKKRINPKRLQRIAKKNIQCGISTKAQVALQKQLENRKLAKKTKQKDNKEFRQAKKFKLHQAKKIQIHKGH